MDKSDINSDLTKRVNVFLGTDKSDSSDGLQLADNLPRIDTSWFNVREIYGATHPGATQPFGMVSVNAMGRKKYKTGYPTGYNGQDFYGLSHFHASGTGTIRWYYNYFLFTPQIGALNFQKKKQKIKSETASPAYYSCTLESGIQAEATVGKRTAMHRFSFPVSESYNLTVDLSNYYQALDTVRVPPGKFPEYISANYTSNSSAEGKVVMNGFPLFFYLEISQKALSYGIFKDNRKIDANKIESGHSSNLGLYFQFENLPSKQVITRIGFSTKSIEKAKTNLEEDISSWNFDAKASQPRQVWSTYLSAIEVSDPDSAAVDLFYSALYKSILKPANLSGENPFWATDNYWTDFATAWDMYSTQLPLVFTFYPKEGQQIANFYIDLFDQFDLFPPAYLMKEGFPWVFSKQASALGNIILSDAIAKNISLPEEKVLDIMAKTVNNERGRLFQKSLPLAPSRTHNVDYSYAAFCTALLADKLGKKTIAAEMMQHSTLWRPMYDEEGILIDDRNTVETENYPKQWFAFYEGNNWNYSFKIWHDMPGLMAMHGGEQEFLATLDWYMNFEPNQTEKQFQGLNNEVDYTVPFAYLYAGRPDRTQQITRIAMAYRFQNTRGGLPGNDDSGAMTSWYVWNALGLFPLAGQDILFIGSPTFKNVKLNLQAGTFTIKTNNNSLNNIYIQSAKLNGEVLDRPFLYFDELSAGGELIFEMGSQPSAWGSNRRPPVYNLK